ncbi:MAG: hypothetical protein AABW89_03945 [Nanoarchaeota archaeon]
MRIVKSRIYVEFIYLHKKPGEEEVETRDARKINAPNESIGFRFFDRTEYIDDEGKTVILSKNCSGISFFGEVLTLKDARKRFPEDTRLKYMMLDERDSVVFTKPFDFYLFRESDSIVSRND